MDNVRRHLVRARAQHCSAGSRPSANGRAVAVRIVCYVMAKVYNPPGGICIALVTERGVSDIMTLIAPLLKPLKKQ